MLFSFLYRNLRGFRLLVILAIIVTVSQVGCDIMAAFPLKFIPSKISNPAADPACTIPFFDPIESFFDTPLLDASLRDPQTHQPVPPPTTQCPISPNDLEAAAHARSTSHSVNGVIAFSIALLFVFGLISAGLAYLDLYMAAYIAQNLTARLRNQLFDHLQRLSLDWHGKQKKGDLVQRVTGNISDIEKLVTDGLVDLLASVLTIVGVASVMLFISWQYTLISLAIAPGLFMLVLGYTRRIKAAAKTASKAAGQVSDVATEDINALTVIKVFTREERESLRFGNYTDKHRRAGLLASGLQAQFTPIVSILILVGTALVLGAGGFVAAGTTLHLGLLTIDAQSVDVGTLILFLTYLKLLYQPMRDLSKLANLSSSAGSGAERIQEVLDQAPEVTDDRQAPYNGPTKLRGDISFERVFFGYTPERPVLKGIDLHIPSGRKVALVGLSGGGKTTLVKLIPRFYETTQGCVKIDGVDNRQYPLHILRQNVSMVLQDSVLFEGSVRENIAIGRPNATEDEIIDAAKKADIHTTIVNVLGGYDRMIREQGKDLSGGQRQRMAIARAILRDAPILVLDEPTASLDVEAEAEVLHALDTLVVGRTVLMISHRLSTLGNVDEIIVLKDGRIVERGNYKELKRQGGVFANLLDEQNRYNVEKVAEKVVEHVGEHSILRSAFSIPAPVRNIPPASPPSPALPGRPPVPASHASPYYPQNPASPGGSQRPFAQPQTPQPAQQRYPTSLPAAKVVVELNGKIISERRLDKPVLTVGRLSGNDVQVPNQRVSRLHAKIRSENGTWIIEDAESVNGILYHGKRVEKLTLSNGDSIAIAPGAILHYHV